MYKAGAMYYAIVVALLISVLSSSVIMYAYYNRVEIIHLELTNQLMDDVHSAMAYSLANPENKEQDTWTLQLFEDADRKVKIKQRQWGLYGLLNASGNYRDFVFSKSAMVGSVLNDYKALYLADVNKPLSLCGKTKIVGAVKLPHSGVKRAYIEGKSFVGTKLIDGSIENSTNQLPPTNTEVLEANLQYFNSQYNANDSLVSISGGELDTVIQHFNEKTLVVKGENIPLISGVYKGNVIISATNSIFIGKAAEMEDVICYAPIIIVESGFIGTVQLFVSDSMVIEDNVKLLYPSSVVGISENNRITMTISEKCKILGSLVSIVDHNSIEQSVVHVGKETTVYGNVFVNNSLDLKGEVVGQLVCNKFRLKTPSSVYENHLLDASIDGVSLSSQFVAANLFESSAGNNIVKWVE